jgi:arsenate reductase (glutaredoxin)
MHQLSFIPSCSKCRAALAALDERGIEAEVIRYVDAAPTPADLERLMSLPCSEDPRSMMRTGGTLYGDLQLDGATSAELLDAVSMHPILLERPIFVTGEKAVVGRPPELVLGLLS